MSVPYVVFCGVCVSVLKELNSIVNEPYMDEPFHVPQAQAYCRGDFGTWDPKITTPPGLYIMSLALKQLFLFKCTLPMLRLTTALALMSLPIILTRLLCYHKRVRPPPLLSPSPEAIVLSAFPISWFFGFLYYTEVPSLAFVAWTVVAASEGHHWIAALLGLISCTFRQTNVVWVFYAFASSQLTWLRFRRVSPGEQPMARFHDPQAISAGLGDVWRAVSTFPSLLRAILPAFLPYTLVLITFGCFIVWNDGIVLGDKSNHIPSLHIPQLYYLVVTVTFFGWPVLISVPGGFQSLACGVWKRMFGTKIRVLIHGILSAVMALTVKLFTIHHPFLLSDNRHYTFYIWRRIYMFHPVVPYALIPVYIACSWAWFLRVGRGQTLFQTLILPVFVVPTLLPTPLLEPRYFLIPYILLRAQVSDGAVWGIILEGIWYCMINVVTMGVFLYMPREGVGRFMW